MKKTLKEIINKIYDLIYDFERTSFNKRVSLIILNYDTYQKISAYDSINNHINQRNKTLLGIPYIIKCDSKIDIEIK